MSTFTGTTKHSATFTGTSKSSPTTGTNSIIIGNPIGLLLALTYAENHGGGTTSIWTGTTKNSSTFTGTTKH